MSFKAVKEKCLPVAVVPAAGDVRIIAAFRADGGLPAVTGVNDSIVRQRHEPGLNAVYQLAAAAAWHERGADTAPEQGVSGEHLAFGEQADAPGRMARGVHDFVMSISNDYFIALVQ